MSAEQFTLIDTDSTIKSFKVDGNTFNPEGNVFGLEEYFGTGKTENLRIFT